MKTDSVGEDASGVGLGASHLANSKHELITSRIECNGVDESALSHQYHIVHYVRVEKPNRHSRGSHRLIRTY